MSMNPPELVDAIMDPMMMAMGSMLGIYLFYELQYCNFTNIYWNVSYKI